MAVTNIKYAGSVANTITIAGLASDVNLLVGWEGNAITNTVNLYDDAIASGQIMTGTTPTAGKIEVWAYSSDDDTPTYPDVITGADSAATISSDDVKFTALRLVASIATGTTSDKAYSFSPRSVVEIFGFMPTHYGFFVTHSTVAALNATGTNSFIKTNGITQTIV